MKKRLSAKQRAFIEHYVAGRNGVRFNATQAAKAAGYSERTASVIGYENLTKPYIKAAIDQRFSDLQMESDEILVRFTEQARGLYGKYIEHDGRVNLMRMVQDGMEHLIKEVEVVQVAEGVTKTKVKFHDAQAALRDMARIKGMYRPEVEVPDVHVHVHGFEEAADIVYGDGEVDADGD